MVFGRNQAKPDPIIYKQDSTNSRLGKQLGKLMMNAYWGAITGEKNVYGKQGGTHLQRPTLSQNV